MLKENQQPHVAALLYVTNASIEPDATRIEQRKPVSSLCYFGGSAHQASCSLRERKGIVGFCSLNS